MRNSKEQKLLKLFGERVSSVRKSRHMTQQDLAEAVEMSVVSIAYIETGKRWVRLVTLQKIAKALNTDVSSLLKGL